MQEFRFSYYSKRYRGSEVVTFTKTDRGWYFSRLAFKGDVDRTGSPLLIGNFRQDNVKYPADIENFIGFIWDELHAGAINHPEAQAMFDQLGQWVTLCEQEQPVLAGLEQVAMQVYREFENGWMFAMNDEVGTRVVPHSVFRFGVKFMEEDCVEVYQPGGASAVRRVKLFPGDTEESVRAFLLSVGFEERPRAAQGQPALKDQV